jgi:(p)ppGpp synthase/HD superfamily hydrolase
MTLTEQAFAIALKAHEGQVRKTDGSPYIIHPVMVSHLLAHHGFGDAVCAAALVHDVLEDTSFREADLRDVLGDEVVTMVAAVSENKALPWEERKRAYIEAVRASSSETKAVSVGDKIHNAQSLIDLHEREGHAAWSHFSRDREQKLWFEEAMLTMLRESWQHPLVETYGVLVEKLRTLV